MIFPLVIQAYSYLDLLGKFWSTGTLLYGGVLVVLTVKALDCEIVVSEFEL